MGSLAFTASKYTQQAGFFPTMPGVTHVPYPNLYRPLFAGPDQGRATLDYIENRPVPEQPAAAEVAAIVVEPIQGEGGYLVPPDGIPAGPARVNATATGSSWSSTRCRAGSPHRKNVRLRALGVAPDIMTLAKGLGSGLPIGLVVARKAHMEKWKRGAHGNTFGGNPICCAAALATLDLVHGEYAAMPPRSAITSSLACASYSNTSTASATCAAKRDS